MFVKNHVLIYPFLHLQVAAVAFSRPVINLTSPALPAQFGSSTHFLDSASDFWAKAAAAYAAVGSGFH